MIAEQRSNRKAAGGESLGRVVRSYVISPAALQRASVVSVLSFLFFLSMLFVFYLRANIVYFILSTAFLLVCLFTLIGWWMQKRAVLHFHEHGIAYKRFTARWEDIVKVKSDAADGITITRADGERVAVPNSISAFEQLAVTLRDRLGA